jgi:MSHA biogenesis protein MshQ
MQAINDSCKYSLPLRLLAAFVFIFFSIITNAATYNLSTGSYPPCTGGSGWSVNGSTYTCGGNGRVTLAAGDIITANSTATIFSNNGFSLAGNTIGTAGVSINLTSNYGTITSSGTNTVYGAMNGGSGDITLTNTTVNGAVITGGNINLTGGGVTGLVTSSSNTITTNGTNLSGGARAQSGMSITGGTLAGSFVMTSNNAATFSGVTMTSGSISGASTVTIQNGSVLGSGSSSISISSTSGAITVNNSIVYGNLTAPGYSTVNVTNGSSIYGSCSPNSTPANACGSTPPPPINCPAGISSGITGNYYNNRTLTEPSTASRNDAPIDFNWGGAAPGPSGINADNFSTRWTGYVRVTQSGAYRFQTVSDDGVRLYVNGNLVINNWSDHSAATDTSADVVLAAGQTYTLVLEYYENAGDAVMRLLWRLPGASSYVAIPGGPIPALGAGLYECTPVAKPPISSCPTSLSAGITGDYFNNQSLTAPVTSRRSDGPINFDWGTGAPGPTGIGVNNFSVQWNGYIRVTQSGVHRFQTNSDDGVRLTVNGDLLIDQWNDHSVTSHTSAAVNLVAGNSYPIKLEYYENGGFAVAQLLWQTPGSGAYVAIPRGSLPISAAGLYECVTTPAAYSITHNATGITCAAEAVTIEARNASGVAFNPPAGTVVTLSTVPATGVWVGGNTFTFTGNESSFTKYLRQTTPGLLTIKAESATALNTSEITFVDTVLRIALNSALANIPTQVAGVNGDAIAKVISTNPKTGVCEAIVASRTLQTGLAFTCNNPTSCVIGQSFTVNGSPIAANNNAAPVTYNNVNLTFNANGEAPMTINYSDVGQVTLHGRLKIEELGNNPELIISASSNPFIVKPYTLAVTAVAQAASPFKANPAGTSNPTQGFIPAGEKFTVNVQSRNALGALTPNFGNEVATSERNKIQLDMGCPERDEVSDPACVVRKPDYPTGDVDNPVIGDTALMIGDDTDLDGDVPYLYGSLLAGASIPRVWNEVGSFKLEPNLSGTGYLGQGNVGVITPSGVIGRFYPAKYVMANQSVINSCNNLFTYMEDSKIKVNYKIHALRVGYDPENSDHLIAGIENWIVKNYRSSYGIDESVTPPKNLKASINYVTENANSGNDLERFSDGINKEWGMGTLNVDSTSAVFSRLSPNGVPDGPYEILQVGLALIDNFDGSILQDLDMDAINEGDCKSTATCTAIGLGVLNMRYGRLRLDDAFGPETADLPVKFITEYWTGSLWIKNTEDSCVTISRNNIFYGNPGTNISLDNNLNVPLNGASTKGIYKNIEDNNNPTVVSFDQGDARHKFSAPGRTGSFPVRVNLASYPWLTFDWNKVNNVPTQEQCNPVPPTLPDSDCSLRATFGFGSYRGHDRVIYWRERF